MDLFLPLCDDFLETFAYLDPPFFPSTILFREPSTEAHSTHQCLQSLLVESLRETQPNFIFAVV